MVGSGMDKHVEYVINGADTLGEINCQRRYSDFDKFRDLLVSRYIGLYIPPLPPKVQDNKKEMIVEERQYFLDQFVREISITPYLKMSEELQVFLRP